MNKFSAYVGLDVHKETIAVAVAMPGREQPEYRGEIPNRPEAIKQLIQKLSPDGEVLSVCYEAGPCGYAIHRQVTGMGHDCIVVAPGLIPRRASDRIKTDRRDALTLARLHRSGELTAVWVPDEEQESMRDLLRARSTIKTTERKARQHLNAFLLRHDKIYRGKSRWTKAHFHWLETVVMPTRVQQIVLQEYIEAEREAHRRLQGLDKQLRKALPEWSMRAVVEALMALRGVSLIVAMTTLAELGDITRFDSPRQLMAYLGLVPSEHSSGPTRHQGGITKTGNGHVRRVLVEAAWAYRYPARKTRVIQRRAEHTSPEVQGIAWKAQKRLCGRYRHLMKAGKRNQVAVTAVARELAGFMWAIAHETPIKGADKAV